MRAQLYMRAFAGATGAKESDRVYVTLPLYHATGGLCGMGAALLNGGCAILRRKFSASHFWEEIVAERCAETILSLPMFAELTLAQVERAAREVREITSRITGAARQAV